MFKREINSNIIIINLLFNKILKIMAVIIAILT